MTEFAPGMRVIIRDEEWMIKKVERNSMGNNTLYCIGVTPLVKDFDAVFLADQETPIPVDPEKVKLIVDESPHYRDALLYLESQWRQKIPTDTKIHIGQRAAMDPMEFQLEPAQMALKQPRQRILIADDVGLGKTLEAGILMSELILRGKGKRILVVTGKSMMAQFQKEMWNRFTIPLVRLDSNKIRQIRNQLPTNYNPFFYYDKTIISIDTLKNDVAYRTHLEQATWDIIVIDEAQSVATRGERQAQRARLAELLAQRSDTMIMLSATPHDGRPRSFASLMNMLDPTAIANPDEYTPDTIKGLFIRRFKKDVKNQMAGVVLDREVHRMACQASTAEETAYNVLTSMHLDMDIERKRGTGQLFQTSLEKALFSSPAACMKTIEARLRKLRKKYKDDDIRDIRLLEDFHTAVAEITSKTFSRYRKLLALLQSPDYNWNRTAKDDRIVIFTERVDTMEYLYDHLVADLKLKKGEIEKISGSMNDEEQQRIVEDFGRLEAKVRILVASDVASEGLNLHYLSHRLIHFDLPWSLMVFQQRNGRIDRYGQKKQPDIRYFVEESQNPKIKGDLRLLEILVEKEEQAQKNIGDPAVLLGKYAVQEEEEEVSKAIENGQSADDFSAMLDANADNTVDDILAFMQEAAEAKSEDKPEITEDRTLFSDIDYLEKAMAYFNQSETHPTERLTRTSGLEIAIDDNIRHRMSNILPREVNEQLQGKSYLRLVSDKQFCMEEVLRCQESSKENAWPEVQYLWRLNPIFDWVNDKAGLIYERDQAPLSIMQNMSPKCQIYILSGSIPNRKSTPLVDEWFGLLYENGHFVKTMTMTEALREAGINGSAQLPNTVDKVNHYTGLQLTCQNQLSDVIRQAKQYLNGFYRDYKERSDSQINEELDKLSHLKEAHKQYRMMQNVNRGKRKQEEGIREVEHIFNEFVDWVEDSMTIENHPYIRVIAVFTGNSQKGAE